jgi:hypothetical protein
MPCLAVSHRLFVSIKQRLSVHARILRTRTTKAHDQGRVLTHTAGIPSTREHWRSISNTRRTGTWFVSR